ncbi:hypothetical protein ARMGADRAFT_1163665 [Armillaria gallica]|uniref:Uncharacterized protein n=1 Tax=Armillaria gallica TaxID=47427 RepID=A0A2H3DLB9_ARMGA|nr:hypothetical protein ARMGADRAFT_1163665 [Armillaria gallica]
MQTRVSTNPVDKVAGLALPLMPETIPAHDESKSLEDAWTALMNSMYARKRAAFLLAYPGVGLGHKQWRPTWEQVMTETLPVNQCSVLEYVEHDDETDEDSFEGSCIEKGHVRGLDVESVEGGDRSGELVVEGADGMQHTFAIRATHQILIPEGTYTLLGSIPGLDDDDIWGQYWAVGLRLPRRRFQKVSVVMMEDKEDIERLEGLGIAAKFRNILV